MEVINYTAMHQEAQPATHRHDQNNMSSELNDLKQQVQVLTNQIRQQTQSNT